MYSILLIKHKYLEFFILNVAVKEQWRKPRPPTKKTLGLIINDPYRDHV